MSRYRDLRAARRCIQCRSGLFDHERTALCEDCRDKKTRWHQTKRVRQRYAEHARAKYRANETAARQKQQARRERKKLAGECRNCKRPALPDSDWCRRHRHKHRQNSRASMFRMRVRRAVLYIELVRWLVAGCPKIDGRTIRHVRLP